MNPSDILSQKKVSIVACLQKHQQMLSEAQHTVSTIVNHLRRHEQEIFDIDQALLLLVEKDVRGVLGGEIVERRGKPLLH